MKVLINFTKRDADDRLAVASVRLQYPDETKTLLVTTPQALTALDKYIKVKSLLDWHEITLKTYTELSGYPSNWGLIQASEALTSFLHDAKVDFLIAYQQLQNKEKTQ